MLRFCNFFIGIDPLSLHIMKRQREFGTGAQDQFDSERSFHHHHHQQSQHSNALKTQDRGGTRGTVPERSQSSVSLVTPSGQAHPAATSSASASSSASGSHKLGRQLMKGLTRIKEKLNASGSEMHIGRTPISTEDALLAEAGSLKVTTTCLFAFAF